MEDHVQARAVDELHRVSSARRRARRRRRPARCSCGAAAPPSGPPAGTAPAGRVDPPVPGQDLQRHVAAERLLDRLVDDPHAAAADLAEDPEIAQPIRRPRPSSPAAGAGLVVRDRLELLHHHQGREHLAYLVGPLVISLNVLGNRRALAAPVAFEEFLGQPVDRAVVRGCGSRLHGYFREGWPGSAQAS